MIIAHRCARLPLPVAVVDPEDQCSGGVETIHSIKKSGRLPGGESVRRRETNEQPDSAITLLDSTPLIADAVGIDLRQATQRRPWCSDSRAA